MFISDYTYVLCTYLLCITRCQDSTLRNYVIYYVALIIL